VRISHRFQDPTLDYWGGGCEVFSDAKSDIIFLLSDPISYKCDEILRLPRLVMEIPILGYLEVFFLGGGFRGI